MSRQKENRKKSPFLKQKSQKVHQGPKGGHPQRVDENLLYGVNPVAEALQNGRRRFEKAFVSEAFKHDNLLQALKSKGVEIVRSRTDQLNQMVAGAAHQGLVVQTKGFPYSYFEDLDFDADPQIILALDSVQDPQNFATLCRSALSFGVKAILIPKDRSVSVTGVVSKSSAGAIEHLHVVQITNLARSLGDLKDRGFWVYGTHLSDDSQSLNLVDPSGKAVLVMGSEGTGLRPLVAGTCDMLVKIPMAGTLDSLNVAQAGSIVLYDFFIKQNS